MADQSTSGPVHIGAARVFVTLDELAAALGVPEGHRLEAVSLPSGECRPGLALIVVGAGLPIEPAHQSVYHCDLASYRRLANRQIIPRGTGPKPLDVCRRRCGGLLRLRVEGLRCDKCGADADGNTERQREMNAAFAPARPVVVGSDHTNWPTFPGQDLDYRNLPETPDETRGDPGDEDIHTGGPR